MVAVDEMFSKTDDEFSQFLLDLFKEFHLQLLIVQPLDAKIHAVQKHAERYPPSSVGTGYPSWEISA